MTSSKLADIYNSLLEGKILLVESFCRYGEVPDDSRESIDERYKQDSYQRWLLYVRPDSGYICSIGIANFVSDFPIYLNGENTRYTSPRAFINSKSPRMLGMEIIATYDSLRTAIWDIRNEMRAAQEVTA